MAKQTRKQYLQKQIKLMPKQDRAAAKAMLSQAEKSGGKITKAELKRIDAAINLNLYGESGYGGTAGVAPWLQTGMTAGATIESPFISTTSISSAPLDKIVKIPERDVVNYQDENIPAEVLTNLLFENLGANELVKFERHDTIEGTNTTYDIISNLSKIRKEYDPSSLISRQKPDTSFFDIYTIKLESKIPDQKYLAENPKILAGGQINTTDYVYIRDNGDLVIELININPDEIIEVEIDSSGTIYEVEL